MKHFEERYVECLGGDGPSVPMEPLTADDWLCGPVISSTWVEGPGTRNRSVLWIAAAFAAGILARHLAVLL